MDLPMLHCAPNYFQFGVIWSINACSRWLPPLFVNPLVTSLIVELIVCVSHNHWSLLSTLFHVTFFSSLITRAEIISRCSLDRLVTADACCVMMEEFWILIRTLNITQHSHKHGTTIIIICIHKMGHQIRCKNLILVNQCVCPSDVKISYLYFEGTQKKPFHYHF